MSLIICVGNRYQATDAAGPLVYERLAQAELPPGVELIDGGLAGLDLSRFMEQAERIVFVDAVLAPDSQDGVVILTAEDVEKDALDTYDHAAGLGYMLRAARQMSDGPLPEIFVVGIAGVPDPGTITTAASLCVSIAADGYLAEQGQEARTAGGAR